jgi:type 1 fimbria pilin
MAAMENIVMKQLPRRGLRTTLQRMFALASLVLCAMLLMSAGAHAQCTRGSGGTAVLTFTMPPTATIPRDAALGTVIASATLTNPGYSTSAPLGVTCTAATTVTYANMYGANTSTATTMPTATPGIGYQVINGSTGAYYTVKTAALPHTYFQPSGPGGCPAGTSGSCYLIIGGPSVPMKLQFVITGPLTGVYTIAATDLFQLSVGGLLDSDLRLGNSIQITGQTCAVTTPSFTVPLNSVKSSVFTGVGTTSPAVPFAIGLNCSGVSTNVGITFTDGTSTGNTTNILTIQPATGPANATGVGIKITPSGGLPGAGTAVSYGPDSAVAGNLHQIMLGASGGLPASLPFTAQYVATATNITAGPANGVATFTMSYQ